MHLLTHVKAPERGKFQIYNLFYAILSLRWKCINLHIFFLTFQSRLFSHIKCHKRVFFYLRGPIFLESEERFVVCKVTKLIDRWNCLRHFQHYLNYIAAASAISMFSIKPLFTNTQHNIFSKPLAAFPYQTMHNIETEIKSRRSDYHHSSKRNWQRQGSSQQTPVFKSSALPNALPCRYSGSAEFQKGWTKKSLLVLGGSFSFIQEDPLFRYIIIIYQ